MNQPTAFNASGNPTAPVGNHAPYQIPETVGVPAQLNADLANTQKRAALIGPANAFTEAYNSIQVGYPGDPMANKFMAGTTMNRNDATQVQGDIYDAIKMAGKLDATIQATLEANPGPTGPGNWWNWSYSAWGLGGGTPDTSLVRGTVLQDPTAPGASPVAATGVVVPTA